MKIVRSIHNEVEIHEIKQMLAEYNGFDDAFNRMMESEEIQGCLAEYLELLKKQALVEDIEFTDKMKERFFEEVREILIIELDKTAIDYLMQDIHTKGISPNQIAETMHQILIEEEIDANERYSTIIKEYLKPMMAVKKPRKKTPLQQMLTVISVN